MKEDIKNEIFDEVQSWILEQKIMELENTLSNTISFFSVFLAIMALIFVAVAWWMNMIFSKKLKEVQASALEVSRNRSNSLELSNELKQNTKFVSEKYEEIGRWEQDIENLKKDLDSHRLYILMTQEASIIQSLKDSFSELERKILDLESQVTEKDISKYKWDDPKDTAQRQYDSHKGYYLDAKKEFEKIDMLKLLEYENFIFKYGDEDDFNPYSKELRETLGEAQGFYNTLKDILKK